MHNSPLRCPTPDAWTEAVVTDFDTFLKDHAGAEKKASGMAMSMISHYPDRVELVAAMTELAIEELAHFREVVKLLHKRDQITGPDAKDPYVLSLRNTMRQGTDVYLLDRLLIAGLIEARGAERFALIAQALEPGGLKDFYRAIAKSEERHYTLFLELAALYFDQASIDARWDELLDIEAALIPTLPIRAALH